MDQFSSDSDIDETAEKFVKLKLTKVKDKADRATVEKVLDPRTRIILFKFLNKEIIDEINGCISTGKEANVYHATCPDGAERAIKIFKTSILQFKDRDKYISGEYRFRHGYCKSNPRKMVRTWAEKEMRNLCRIFQAGINCPQPYLLKSHVILMGFVGEKGLPAPLLKDAEINRSEASKLYLECVLMMSTMSRQCKLVHGDLSEYNLLYHKGKLVMIDVSQSVEWDHPMAYEFLRKDCVNVNDFFRRKGVATMTSRELFEFILNPNINESNRDEHLSKLQEIISARSFQELTNQEKIDEEVFKGSFIPQRLDQVIDAERDIFQPEINKEAQLYKDLNSLNDKLSSSDDDDYKSSSESNNDEDVNMSIKEETKGDRVTQRRPRNESPESRKRRKRLAQLEKQEKRKTKIPKHIKKTSTKAGKAKR
ncbi:serine/threonine-protein kinase RIO1-like [Panonychus citri]|uniref:serine/threonine-protein kinase RIO1-like n=1 Tax=Panonychus citri TaxID=50023 RepID=UPI002307386B|nr:serine/threonine-protein kinase RIO1-like [Panonychus citri]